LGDFGTIENQTLGQVLESSAYRHLMATYREHPLCQTCNMRKPA
jgi:hypothetical protein